MMSVKSFCLIFISLTLVSCSSNTRSTIRYNGISKKADKSLICIYRVYNFAGSAVPFYLLLDNKELSDLNIKGYLVAEVAPGPHQLSLPPMLISWGRGNFIYTNSNQVHTNILCVTNKVIYIKIDPAIHIVEEDAAGKDLQNMFNETPDF